MLTDAGGGCLTAGTEAGGQGASDSGKLNGGCRCVCGSPTSTCANLRVWAVFLLYQIDRSGACVHFKNPADPFAALYTCIPCAHTPSKES